MPVSNSNSSFEFETTGGMGGSRPPFTHGILEIEVFADLQKEHHLVKPAKMS
jgi:hypothetical protein